MHETKHCPTIIPRFSNSTSGFKGTTSEIRGISHRVPTSSRHFEVTSSGQRCYVTPANGSNTIHDIVHFVDRLSRHPLSLVSVHRDRRASREKRSTVSRHFHRPFIDPRKWNEPTKFRGDRNGRTVIENRRWTWLVVGNRKLRLYYWREKILYGVIHDCNVHSRKISNIMKGLL